MKIRNFVSVGVLLSVLAGPVVIRANAAPKTAAVYGTIISAGATQISIKETEKGTTLSILVDSKFTKLVIKGKDNPMDSSKLKAGTEVRIFYKLKDGKMLARFITLDPVKRKKK